MNHNDNEKAGYSYLLFHYGASNILFSDRGVNPVSYLRVFVCILRLTCIVVHGNTSFAIENLEGFLFSDISVMTLVIHIMTFRGSLRQFSTKVFTP